MVSRLSARKGQTRGCKGFQSTSIHARLDFGQLQSNCQVLVSCHCVRLLGRFCFSQGCCPLPSAPPYHRPQRLSTVSLCKGDVPFHLGPKCTSPFCTELAEAQGRCTPPLMKSDTGRGLNMRRKCVCNAPVFLRFEVDNN